MEDASAARGMRSYFLWFGRTCRTFLLGQRQQNISLVGFSNIERLDVDIRNVDFGSKEFVFKSVRNLRLSGYLQHPSTRVSLYVLNDQYNRGDVFFDDFKADSTIQLINIQV